MKKFTKESRTQAMTIYIRTLAREHEVWKNVIKSSIEGFPQDIYEDLDGEAGLVAFKHYHELRE
ncbi:unnamed protein product, partial [Rotaria magnacalcarata]